MSAIEIASIIGGGIIFIFLAVVRWIGRKHPQPPQSKIQEKIRESAREEIKQLEQAHSSVYDGDRFSIADMVARDVERIRRERDK
jgi:glutathione S-transferase